MNAIAAAIPNDSSALNALHAACDAEDWAAAGDILADHARTINEAVARAPRDRAVLQSLHARHLALEQALLERRDRVRQELQSMRRVGSAAQAYREAR